MRYGIFIVFAFVVFASCSTPRLYRENKKFESGELTPGDLESLKQYLSATSPQSLSDTIIIKFDFNRERCWDNLDKESDEYINRVLAGYQSRIKEAAARPGVTIYQFREPGKAISKYKLWNQDILTDIGYLRQNLFKERTVCGSSVIVAPSGKYLLIKSDSHFDAIRLTGPELAAVWKQRA